MAAKRKTSHALTDLERHALVGFQARYRVLDLERQAVLADQRAFEAAMAERLGLPAGSLGGSRYAVNTDTWTLEPVETPANGQ